MVRAMMDLYDFPCELIHRDNGNAFFDNGREVLEEGGYKAIASPPAIHQWVSANDNSLHAVGKRRWRTARRREQLDFTDDLDATLQLMNAFDNIESDSIKSWMTKNFFMCRREPTDAEIKKHIGRAATKNPEYFARCLTMYHRTILDKKMSNMDANLRIDTLLDGRYWKS